MNILKQQLMSLLMLVFIVSLSACGGGSSEVEEVVVETKSCQLDADEANSSDDCGLVLIGLTDADGDFLNYAVDVSGLELYRQDGAIVSVITTSQTVNFVDYVALTELAAAATIPAGVYTGGAIHLDYTNADIQVEKDGEPVAAQMLDAEGNSLSSLSLELQFDQNNRLVVGRHRAAMLELDFNLAASHTVDLNAEPVSVTTEAFIVAEVDPMTQKEFRLRGGLLSVSLDDSLFRMAVRPFHRQDGRFGGVNVHINDETQFEINQVQVAGADGLTQMADLGQGTPTLSFGLFNRAEQMFTAYHVLAGSSVPGSEHDAAVGVISARDGNLLTVKGASLIRTDGEVNFRDTIMVTIADTTQVSKPRRIDESVTIADLSVGQAVSILGEMIMTDDGTSLDASEGAIRMRLTYAAGLSVGQEDAVIAIDLQALQGRSPEIYDFGGTGVDASFDADPDHYEVSTERLIVSSIENASPLRIAGFVRPFGLAPADFEAYSVTDYRQAHSQLFIDWPLVDNGVAFSEITESSMTINIINGGEDGIYKLIQGGIRTDLTSFDGQVAISAQGERGLYSIKQDDRISGYSNFADFSTALQLALNEGETIDGMHAEGGFSADELTFSAHKMLIKLD